MPEAIEWLQCKGCGRRHRWTAERAGKTFLCSCGRPIYCPEGASAQITTSPSDTLIEDVDSPTAVAPDVEALGLGEITGGAASPAFRPLFGSEARRADKKMLTWTIWLFIGLAMVIHVVVLFPSRDHLLVLFWVYASLAVLIAPLALWRWTKARHRWQRGRPFLMALQHTIQRFDDQPH